MPSYADFPTTIQNPCPPLSPQLYAHYLVWHENTRHLLLGSLHGGNTQATAGSWHNEVHVHLGKHESAAQRLRAHSLPPANTTDLQRGDNPSSPLTYLAAPPTPPGAKREANKSTRGLVRCATWHTTEHPPANATQPATRATCIPPPHLNQGTGTLVGSTS